MPRLYQTFGVLSAAAAAFALMQSLVTPVLPTIQHDLHTDTGTVTWVLTAWLLPASVATHALTVGAVGGLVIGMMTRVALGHTARPLVAGRVEVTCYALILLAALVRVFVPIVVPDAAAAGVLCSAALWSAGFALFAVAYWPVLTHPRLDGRPG